MELSELINIIIVPIISLFGWVLKSLITTVKREVSIQTKKFDELINKFSQFEVILSHVEKDVEKFNSQLIHNQTATQKNSDRITSHGHEIGNLKSNVKGILLALEEVEKKTVDLEKQIIVINGWLSNKP